MVCNCKYFKACMGCVGLPEDVHTVAALWNAMHSNSERSQAESKHDNRNGLSVNLADLQEEEPYSSFQMT